MAKQVKVKIHVSTLVVWRASEVANRLVKVSSSPPEDGERDTIPALKDSPSAPWCSFMQQAYIKYLELC